MNIDLENLLNVFQFRRSNLELVLLVVNLSQKHSMMQLVSISLEWICKVLKQYPELL